MSKKCDINMLRRLMSYDPETGQITWRERTVTDCPKEKERKRWNGRYAGREAFRIVPSGYRVGMIFRSMYRAHRVAWAMHYGVWPTGEIDHINGNRADNRIANLRDVSKAENIRNQKVRRNNRTGAIGVYPLRNKWRATIYRGKCIHLGMFATFDKALAARKQAERDLGFHENHGCR